MIKGALFDLDGVIADTSRYHFQAWQQLVQSQWQKKLPATFEQQTKGVSRTDSLQKIITFLQINVTEEEFNNLLAIKNKMYLRLLADLTPANILPGITTLLSNLRHQKIKIALASASQNAPLILKKLNLLSSFDYLADPTKVKAGKPAPDIFLEAAAGIKIHPQDCFGLEDSIAGIDAINAAEVFSVGVGSQTELHAANLLFATTNDISLDTIEQKFK
ncbi:beta-phosphoglucomutase [Bombilactobacillus thymidiniphilus]|uniref:Beta-phosphoglucomutase n=1 Tax=Bombilactobacillus thymidiniphilus TaxID=2923363 RepID=A0ABY4PCL9_9LACO|nr:beta-phosphoglucomutase [Bombilactobacillus thymidiniphilus]UQS83399.1 beta-phosphoglucomutase [Bombilactobacillus thymidiniphilus]